MQLYSRQLLRVGIEVRKKTSIENVSFGMTFIDFMLKSHNVTFSLARRLEIMQSTNGWNLTTNIIESSRERATHSVQST